MVRPQEPPRKRRRPALSCVACRIRKVKCDRQQPCGRCIDQHVGCPYRPSPHPSGSQQCGQRPSLPAGSPQDRRYIPTVSSEGFIEAGIETVSDGLMTLPQSLQSPFQRVDGLKERLLSLSAPLTQNDASRPREQVPRTRFRSTSHGKAVLVGEMPAKFMEFFYALVGHNDGRWSQRLSQSMTDCRDLLQECKALARELKALEKPGLGLSQLINPMSPPERKVADRLATSYFDAFETTHRIVHAPSFWSDYRQYWRDPSKAPYVLQLKVLLVVTIGSSLEDVDECHFFRRSVLRWIYAAQMWLAGPLEKDRLNMDGVTVHCLVLFARLVLGVSVDLIWASSGALIHHAMQVGLHRDPKHLPPMPFLRAEIRRRLWATILEIVLQASLDSGMPPRVSTSDFDTAPPANVPDEVADESSMEARQLPENVFTSTSTQRILLMSVPVRIRILNAVNGIRTDLSFPEAVVLGSEMAQTIRQTSVVKSSPESTPLQRNMLDFFLRRFLLSLHASLALHSWNDPAAQHSRKAAFDSAVAILSPEPDPHFERMMSTTAGFLKAGIRLAGGVVSLELVSHTRAQCEDLSLNRTADYRNVVGGMMSKLLSVSESQLRGNQSNVKDHMVLCTAIAEAKAVERGTSEELEIVRGAQQSLELCRALLQGRLNTASAPVQDNIETSGDNCGFGMNDDAVFDIWTFLQDGDFD